MLKSRRFKKPVICIGNIAVGGTGKTPHAEYIINKLINQYSLAVLSRGYKRKTKGYFDVKANSKVSEVGDEPLQIKKKFKNINVAVDEDRVHGIETLLAKDKAPEVILLDDAFQHRKVTAGFRVLLTDYNRLITKDFLMPVGRLREHRHNRKRAHTVIITKCPFDLKPFDFRVLSKQIDLYPYQTLYFTTFSYKELVPLVGTKAKYKTLSDLKGKDTIVVTGIANPKMLYNEVKRAGCVMHKMTFEDHHHFTKKDLNTIANKYHSIEDNKPVVICTEKDAVKLNEILDKRVQHISFYYLPIEVSFLNNGEADFINELESFVSNSNK